MPRASRNQLNKPANDILIDPRFSGVFLRLPTSTPSLAFLSIFCSRPHGAKLATMVSSDVNYMMSDAASRPAATPRRRFPSSSGARPRAPPSESNVGVPSDDEGEGFADDHVPGRGRRGPSDVPPVEDKVGLTVQENFEDFIEK